MTTAARTKLTTHNKLVRDGIPAEIRARGAFCETVQLQQSEFRQALAAKLNDAVCRKMREKGRFTNRTFLIESWEEKA